MAQGEEFRAGFGIPHADSAIKGRREVDYLELGTHQAQLFDGDALKAGMQFEGPAIIEEAGATVVIPPGAFCQVDGYGNYLILT